MTEKTGHAFFRVATELNILSATSEACLRKLSYKFIRNGTSNLTEFEVSEPVSIRIVLEKRSDPEVTSSLILPSVKSAKGCNLDAWFTVSEGYSQGRAAESVDDFSGEAAVRQFLGSLAASLPSPPWAGLSFRESGREKKKWKEFSSRSS
jgi:hypothetical protein